MKRYFFALVLTLSMGFNAIADEGMWLLPLIEKMNAGAMRDLGCRLSPEQIYSINNSSLKDAVVIFGGGCTGEVISDQGLVVTNHHCGYSSIQKISTPEHNYLEDGYWAMSKTQELPVEGLKVTFLESMTDITDALNKLSGDKRTEKEKAIIEQAQSANPGCKVFVQDFYDSNIYYLIVYKVYTDIRLVGTPPASMGKFGGDTDNWMWPRHTCDFSMFRIYAGPDGNPADFSKDNVPLRAKKSLNISLKGYEKNDFAMVIGFPGSTQRYATSIQLSDMIVTQDVSIAARTLRQDIMRDAMRKDPKINLQYANKYASSSNGWKKWIGEKESFEKLDIIRREREKEDSFNKWVNKRKKRRTLYGGALENINMADASATPDYSNLLLLSETILKSEICRFPHYMMTEYVGTNVEDSIKAFEQAMDEIAPLYKDYNVDLDKKITLAMLEHYRANCPESDLIEIKGKDFAKMDLKAYVDEIFEKSAFTSEEKMRASLKNMVDVANDIAFPLYTAAMEKAYNFYGSYSAITGSVTEDQKKYTAGLMEWQKGKAIYPDANFTMRLTYGKVLPYTTPEGVYNEYYTTLKGVIDKEDPNNYEFRVPAKVKEIYAKKDFGDYALPNGEMPACFITDCDITGGNSGSPVLDADGNLIGLAFDGNWEAMSSDVLFEPELTRCICVDIRYVLLMMDKFGGAGYLRDEMNIVK